MPTARTPQSPARFRLPDPPRREPDEMTSYDHLHKPGSPHYLAWHFGRPDTTLVEAERWISAQPDADRSSGRRPDLLIDFDVNPAAYQASNGYIISEQGKPPDFVMEIASETTAETDVGEKRDEYAALGIAEYWRFDQTGEYHGTRLAGDRLVDGQYVPITIEELPDGNLQGYSAALNLNLQGYSGLLVWHDPATGLGNSCSICILFLMVIGKRIRLTDWGRQYGLDPQSTWRMLNEGRLPAHLEVERIGRLWYVILPDEEPALLTVGYARVSSHEQKPQLEPQANRLWAHAGQNGIKLDRVVSEVASGLNDRRPELRRLLADPQVGYILVEHRDRLARFGVGMVDAMLQARGGRSAG